MAEEKVVYNNEIYNILHDYGKMVKLKSKKKIQVLHILMLS